MTRLLIYVEGPSDKMALSALLAPLLAELLQRSVLVIFFSEDSGDRKKALLLKVPTKAVNILYSQPRTHVVVIPDLYPKNRGFAHETFQELDRGIRSQFRGEMGRRAVRDTVDLERRFHVFCFKHDLEALVLASFEALKTRLETPNLTRSWSLPVEDINHNRPPKRVVEDLFQHSGQRYRETVDAPLILGSSRFQEIAAECSQCFKPFVEFLSSFDG